MTDIILLSAVSRPSNLPVMYESVKEAFGSTKEEREAKGFNVSWAIVRDQYNCKSTGDVGSFYEQLFKDGFQFWGFSGGLPNQKNFGGDMYNVALEWLFEHIDGNPWVYIFDDDNVICPMLGYYIQECEKIMPDKAGMWLNYSWPLGDRFIVHEGVAFEVIKHTDTWWTFLNNPDPSSVFLRLSVYRDNFPLNGGGDYDFSQFRGICEELYKKGELRLHNDVDYVWRERTGAFHNGIVDYEELKKDLNDPESLGITCTVEDWVRVPECRLNHRYVLPAKANREILEIIRKYGYAISRE